MSPEVKAVLNEAIDKFDDIQGNAGCNDIWFPDTPELRALYHEFSLNNCPEATGPEHDQYMAPSGVSHGQLLGQDAFIIFLLRKYLNLL